MSEFSEIRQHISKLESLERDLHLKQLQINRLLSITQAINNNVSADGLFEMYRDFLSWELGIKKMALYVRGDEDEWQCTSHLHVPTALLTEDVASRLPSYLRLRNLEEEQHPLLKLFDVVIPVRHKDTAIAYVFIGGFSEEDDMYNKVQLITTITNIIAVAIENKRLFKRQLEQERLKREMELAGEVQKMLIPKTLPQTDEYSFASIYKPQLGVGGDYFDYIQFEDGKIVFCIGDFTGKGVAAALLMANFQANFHTLINKRATLDEFIRDLNHSVNLITGGERFITFFIAEYDRQKKLLRYINAGHNPPLLMTDAGLAELREGCIMLGPYPEIPNIQVGEISLNNTREAVILAYTDGLIDIRNPEGIFFSEELLNGFIQDNYQLDTDDLNQRLMTFIDDFRKSEVYPDDFTILTGKIYCGKDTKVH